jgi:uncharacterized protein
VVDFSWEKPADANEKLAKLAKSFHIYDHHKSQGYLLEGRPFATFDITRSGAALAWDYIFGTDRHLYDSGFRLPEPRPWYVNYAQDRDLWRWELPRSKEINAYLGTVPRDIRLWDIRVANFDVEMAATLGVGALQQIEAYVCDGLRQAQKGQLWFVDEEGWVRSLEVAVVNALATNISELCGELADWPDINVAIGWFERGDGLIQFELRGHKGTDVGKLAKAKGGGGHMNAAGFELNIEEGRVLIDSMLGRPLGGESGKVFYAPMKIKA